MNCQILVSRALILLLLLSCTSQAASRDDTTVKTYPLVITDTNVVFEAIRAIAGNEVKLFFYQPGNEIIVSATSNQHSLISQLLKEINVPSPNIRIEVEFLQSGKETDSGMGLTSRAGPRISRSGNSYKIEASPHIRSQSTTTMDNNSQSVVVKDGKQASIFMGTEVPFYLWLIDFAARYEYINAIEQQFEMKQVGSSLAVQPKILNRGPLISVILTPELSGVVKGKPHRLQYTRVATEVTVSTGETVTIGNFGKNSEFYSKFLIGMDKHGNKSTLQVRLTATIQAPAARK